MDDPTIITAKTYGSPTGDETPWEPGHPTVGERVAIFAFDVIAVDGAPTKIRTYHVTPVGRACEGTIVPEDRTPQGTTVRWSGCGAGTVVRAGVALDREQASMDPDAAAEVMFQCQVRPDLPELAPAD